MSLFSSGNGFLIRSSVIKVVMCVLELNKHSCFFPLSDNKAINCFDLIHCGIWGAYRVESLCGAHYFFSIVEEASRGT